MSVEIVESPAESVPGGDRPGPDSEPAEDAEYVPGEDDPANEAIPPAI